MTLIRALSGIFSSVAKIVQAASSATGSHVKSKGQGHVHI